MGLAQQYRRGVSEENGHNKVRSEQVDGSLGEGQFGGGRLELGTSGGEWGVGNRCSRFCGGNNSGVGVRKFKNTVVSRDGEVWGRGVDGLGKPGVIVHLDVEGRL